MKKYRKNIAKFIIFIASTTFFVNSLTSQTKREYLVFNEINELRKNPKSFIPKIQKSIQNNLNLINNNLFEADSIGELKIISEIRAMEEAIEYLDTVRSVDTIQFCNRIYKKQMDYDYSKCYPSNPHTDIKLENFESIGENISRKKNPQKIVLELIIDYGNLKRSHRNNLMNPNWKYGSVYEVNTSNITFIQNFYN